MAVARLILSEQLEPASKLTVEGSCHFPTRHHPPDRYSLLAEHDCTFRFCSQFQTALLSRLWAL